MSKLSGLSAPSKKSAPKNFESALAELEEIAARLERGGAPLDEMTAMYGRGAVLIEYCKNRLRAARGTIQKLEKQTLGGMDDVGE
ncbi:MAG: exodeoxyribonuclease VII small subunit [Betaproteobacteria bacterium]|nr:exodeoxyribonuclease VII small subunit [Betaproteobacteria bacterium]